MDEINKIRKSFFGGKNKHRLALQYNRSWETIDRIVSMDREDLNNRGKRQGRKSRVMTEEVVEAIESYFDEEEKLAVKCKQRYTAQVIYPTFRGSCRILVDFLKRRTENFQYSVPFLREI